MGRWVPCSADFVRCLGFVGGRCAQCEPLVERCQERFQTLHKLNAPSEEPFREFFLC